MLVTCCSNKWNRRKCWEAGITSSSSRRWSVWS